jgi:hypothetical protein
MSDSDLAAEVKRSRLSQKFDKVPVHESGPSIFCLDTLAHRE